MKTLCPTSFENLWFATKQKTCSPPALMLQYWSILQKRCNWGRTSALRHFNWKLRRHHLHYLLWALKFFPIIWSLATEKTVGASKDNVTIKFKAIKLKQVINRISVKTKTELMNYKKTESYIFLWLPAY